jgi:hypothetical protein
MTRTSTCLEAFGSGSLQVAGVGLCVISVETAWLRLFASLTTAIQIDTSRHRQVSTRIVCRRLKTAMLRGV